MLVYLWTFLGRNLPHRVTEADRRQICTRWVSRQQRSGHQRPSNHWWAEGQQTPVLPKPVTLHDTYLPPLHIHPVITSPLHLLFHSCSSALFYSLPSFVFYIELLNSLVLFSFAMKENFKKPSRHFINLLVRFCFSCFFSWSQCEARQSLLL